MADLFHLIYSSTPFGYDAADLRGILLKARQNNTVRGITGALVCRHDVFVQYLEGPKNAIEATYAKIVRDDRHVDVTLRSSGKIEERLFKDWAMLHDPVQSLIWSVEEVDAGALDLADDAQFRDAFIALSAKARAA